MERQAMLAAIKGRMPEKRYIHTIGVMETAIHLAQRYGQDEKKAEIAAIFHDIAKYAEVEWMRKIVYEQNLDPRLLQWDSEILHGPVGAWIVQNEFHIDDKDILNAIRFHTTGRANMSTFEKIIFVADMIEPNRKFPGVDELRAFAEVDLNDAFRACVLHSLMHLVSSQIAIYPVSIECYNSLMREE
ncbi:bis(5'-nucleosyl)-tetraphosphatase (symmetrical) YqeK [Solibacillus sp. MA9]|uniref:bis(5'-nucleosyl)-tetraphosphatase (symmetrical) n=1 Tax=Solibacillus palustris TaxID=2908203 RepID=A0ABS9UDX2_9BACL|nr:bis(5'-nucleosyl)-tetraphosphatase (symmetrical) YqeK [Solibacillus sp. MA9]MCH7322180.1 bis(5'-nucleosyl)-tetraphosphatase (symmetrical) YqeK [Solibacillus sp. MA9]